MTKTTISGGNSVASNGAQLKQYAFKPGVSGNPTGRPKLPPELAAIRSLTQQEICKLISKYARMTRDELQAALAAKATSVIELSFASMFDKSIELGDFTRISFLLDRAIGKAPVAIEDDEAREEREALGKMSMSDLLKIVKENLPEAS